MPSGRVLAAPPPVRHMPQSLPINTKGHDDDGPRGTSGAATPYGDWRASRASRLTLDQGPVSASDTSSCAFPQRAGSRAKLHMRYHVLRSRKTSHVRIVGARATRSYFALRRTPSKNMRRAALPSCPHHCAVAPAGGKSSTPQVCS